MSLAVVILLAVVFIAQFGLIVSGIVARICAESICRPMLNDWAAREGVEIVTDDAYFGDLPFLVKLSRNGRFYKLKVRKDATEHRVHVFIGHWYWGLVWPKLTAWWWVGKWEKRQ